MVVDMPGRPLVSATVLVPIGAGDEPPDDAGAAVLAARALTEGTERYDAVQLTEAAERLGASIHAEAGWDATSVGIDVPSTPSSCSPRSCCVRRSRRTRSTASATSD